MSDLTEQEILNCHRTRLGDACDACAELARNADPAYLAPRGPHYRKLKVAMQELEGSSRQMSMYRDDARWTRLGFMYAKAMQVAENLFKRRNWGKFKEFGQIFERGLRDMDTLANGRTGRIGAILPANPSSWIVMPEKPVPQGLWTPQGRA